MHNLVFNLETTEFQMHFAQYKNALVIVEKKFNRAIIELVFQTPLFRVENAKLRFGYKKEQVDKRQDTAQTDDTMRLPVQ